MLSKLMLSEVNTLLVDQPTNHLDLESISSVNKGLKEFKGSILLVSHDHRLLNTVTNKVVEIGDLGSYIFAGTFDDFLTSDRAKEETAKLYKDK
jgi:ATPase subunit of ABC transporter with duplicated ATPase domains